MSWVFREIVSKLFDENTVFAALQSDTAGYLWLVASTGIYRMSPNGEVKDVNIEGGGSLLVDNQGQIWVGGSGTDSGLRLFVISADGRTVQLKTTYRMADGLPQENSMFDIRQTSDGNILVQAGGALCEFLPNAAENESKFKVVARGNFQTIAEDGGGNWWLGTVEEGAWKIFPDGFVKYDTSDGLPNDNILSLFTNHDGDVFITGGKQKIFRLADGRFEGIVPAGIKSHSWGTGQLDFQNTNGEWWISSTEGLRIYAGTKSFADLGITAPKKVLTTAGGLYGDEIANLFQDSRGDVWISTISSVNSLQRWDQEKGKIIRYSTEDGLPKSNGAVAFEEDADHNVWFGFYFGGLARYRNGKFQFFTASDGIPEGTIHNIYKDKKDRLWIATKSRGVFRVDNPTAEKPSFVNLSTADGLSSNRANCVTEDNFGQIYIGTGRGFNRIDPGSGNIKLYTQADGLPGSVVSLCGHEENGTLWFVSRNSLIKYVPRQAPALKSPAVFIGGISVNGEAQKISELGDENPGQLHLDSDQHQIKIDFFAIGFGTGDQIHYQYKLDNQDWSGPSEEKSVTFNLASGDYQFFVRAVNADGITSDRPAGVSLTIAPPLFRRWWFMLLSALFISGIILTIERYRAARLRELKEAFSKLSASEQRFRRMIEQSSLGFVIFTPDGHLRSVNSAYEKFWNITFDQIKDWKMLEDEQLIKAGVAEKLQRVFAGENISIPPIAYDPQKNGAGVTVASSDEPLWIQSFAYPVKSDSGELLEVIMVMEDVTQFKKSESKLQTVRAERLYELEQVRRRIAADLHDDIGSSLTQISIFSEVLQQRIDKTNERVMEPLEFIASSSRELVDAMSDIVWAINPQKDFLGELSGKMHRFAADVFTARNIKLEYTASPSANHLALGANLRREVFLIFKESVNNIVKHAACRSVKIKLVIKNSEIHLSLSDDGVGFEAGEKKHGHGLGSMKQRAAGLNGHLEIVPGKISGTKVSLVVPLVINTDD